MKYRKILLDCGRKHFTKEWIIRLLDFMGDLGYNQLNLHFSEDLGYRIASDIYPQIVSPEYHSKADIREIVDHARGCSIDIVPEFDMPGHLRHILDIFPEYRLTDDWGNSSGAIDITNPVAVDFLKELMEEQFALFHDSKYFQIGADEFINFCEPAWYPRLLAYAKMKYGHIATGLESYVDFVNDMTRFVRAHGFVPRLWNDGFFREDHTSLVELDREIQICFWTKHENMTGVHTYAEKGYELINCNRQYLYYCLTDYEYYNNPGPDGKYTFPSAKNITENFLPHEFPFEDLLEERYMSQLTGVAFCIWCDVPNRQTQDEIFKRIQEPLKALANVLNNWK